MSMILFFIFVALFTVSLEKIVAIHSSERYTSEPIKYNLN